MAEKKKGLGILAHFPQEEETPAEPEIVKEEEEKLRGY